MSKSLGLGEYYGKCLRSRRVHGFFFTENQFPSGRSIGAHHHTFSHLTLVLAGEFVESYQSRSLIAPAGSVLVVPKSQAHTDRVGNDGAHSLSIEISDRIGNRVAKENPLLNEPNVISHPNISPLISSVYREFCKGDNGSSFALETLAMQLLVESLRLLAAEKARPLEPEPEWLTRAMEKLVNEFMGDLSLEDLALEAGVHKTHFARVFRARYNCTAGEYIRKLRLQEGAKRLRETMEPISEISLATGFCDQSHFSKTFKLVYKVTPHAYRCANRIQIANLAQVVS